jgi:hypothetical protein
MLGGGLVVETLEVPCTSGVDEYGCCRAALARLFCDEEDGDWKEVRLNFPGEMLRSLRGALLVRLLMLPSSFVVTLFRHDKIWSEAVCGPARELCEMEFLREWDPPEVRVIMLFDLPSIFLENAEPVSQDSTRRFEAQSHLKTLMFPR